MSEAPQLRLDKSRHFSTVHGEREPHDTMAGIHFFQDGLPFDAQEVYVASYLDDQTDKGGKVRALAERRLRKLQGQATVADAEAEAHEPDPANTGKAGDESSDLNLVAWARGETSYLFGQVREAIRSRYSQVVKDQRGAVEALLDEKVIREEELSRPFKQMLGTKD